MELEPREFCQLCNNNTAVDGDLSDGGRGRHLCNELENKRFCNYHRYDAYYFTNDRLVLNDEQNCLLQKSFEARKIETDIEEELDRDKVEYRVNTIST